MDPDPSPLIIEFIVILICLMFSAAFSASETAITSFNELRAKQLMERLGKRARILEFWLRHPTRTLTTILVGNNLVNVLASALATDIVLTIYPQGGILVATLTMTISILLLSEVLPKVFAKTHSERFVLVALRFVRTMYTLLYPAVLLFSHIADAALRMAGGSLKERPALTEEELEFLIGIGEKEGTLEKEKRKLLENVFEFGKTVVREVMIPRTDMVTISAQSRGAEAVELMLEKGHSRLPVFDGRLDNVIGIVHAKDLLKKVRECPRLDFPVRDATREPIIVGETKPVDELLVEMKNKKRQMAIVVDEHGGTAGLITFEDLIEEIVGEVRDEYDENEEDLIQQVSPGRFIVDARLNFDDFVSNFETHIESVEQPEPDENELEAEGVYDTVGGFVIDKLGHIPQAGEQLRLGRLLMKVNDVGRRRIRKVEVLVERPLETLAEAH